MASFGRVLKIFIGVGFSSMGFPGYIVCLYVVACDNAYSSLIIMLMLLGFNLKTGIKAMFGLVMLVGVSMLNQIVGCMFTGYRHPSSNFWVHVKLIRRQVWIYLDAKIIRYPSYAQRRDVASSVE